MRPAQIVLALALLAPAIAHADRKWEEVALVASAAGDLVSTEVGLSRGLEEGNPVVQNRAARIALKGVVTAAQLTLARKLDSDGHHGWASAVRFVGIGFNVSATGWNTYAVIKWGE